jgi:hypothetical protein
MGSRSQSFSIWCHVVWYSHINGLEELLAYISRAEIFFYPEDGGTMLLKNNGIYLITT